MKFDEKFTFSMPQGNVFYAASYIKEQAIKENKNLTIMHSR